MLIAKVITDVAGEVLAFGIGGQEITIGLGREVEVAVKLAATKEQIQNALGRAVCGCSENA